ncbi:MAG: D-2-hydroxyacid dehydrogenase [Chloroflexi bacterium]|nr:D-2-hydroxyacid dehydrogenase [Chloroflexota bacterium]
MEKVEILVVAPLTQEQLQMVQAASPNLQVTQTQEPTEVSALWPSVEVVLGVRFPRECGPTPKLRWIQLSSAGVNHLIDTPFFAEELPLITTSSGIHEVPISEHILGAMLMIVRRYPILLRQQFERRPLIKRSEVYPEELWGKTLAIVGLGHIGRALAQRARAFGVRVIATRRSAAPGMAEPDVDQLYPLNRLHQMLAEADFVALTLPLTKESRYLISEAELRAMKPTAYIINISRGELINERVLIRALREGWIAGAALDVVEKEPLSFDNELFELSNVILTPHVAGDTVRYWERTTVIFCENLRRYLAGDPLINLVDKARQY